MNQQSHKIQVSQVSLAYTADPSYRLGNSQGATHVIPLTSSSNNMMVPHRFTQKKYDHIYQMLKQEDFKIFDTASTNM